jgi:hypothetical protein
VELYLPYPYMSSWHRHGQLYFKWHLGFSTESELYYRLRDSATYMALRDVKNESTGESVRNKVRFRRRTAELCVD